MSDRDAWRQKAGDVEESPIPGKPQSTYPLLGEEFAAETPLSRPPWKIRVVLREPCSPEFLESLSQGVAEVRVLDETGDPGELLESLLEVRVRGQEARLRTDLALLRNVAEIRRLRAENEKLCSWTLLTEGQGSDDPEELVGETLRQLAGVLGGCDTIEVRQGVGETFGALWSRINVARLMATEAELERIPDPVCGSGFFSELQARLGS